MALSKHLNDVVLVGGLLSTFCFSNKQLRKTFKNRSKDVSYDSFVAELKNAGFEVDLTTLDKSRRCSAEICQYVSGKLGINISSHGETMGSIIWVDENAAAILENQQIIKLLYKDAASYSFRAINWSYSKGDTMDAVCVILTDNFEKLTDDEFSTKEISGSTINKLYVAMTRSRGNLYLMRASTFKKIRDLYVKK